MDGDHRLGGNGETGFGNGLGVVLGKYVLHRLPEQILPGGIGSDVGAGHLEVLVGLGVLCIDLVQCLAQRIAGEGDLNLGRAFFLRKNSYLHVNSPLVDI